MGTILIAVPDFGDEELIFDESETKQILSFFWPSRSAQISGLNIDNDARRLAQTALVAAIDGSYSMGYVEALFRTVVRPGSGIKAFGKKLARRFVKHWWKNAKPKDLEDVRIYESVRNSIALGLSSRMLDVLNGISVSRAPLQWYARITSNAAFG